MELRTVRKYVPFFPMGTERVASTEPPALSFEAMTVSAGAGPRSSTTGSRPDGVAFPTATDASAGPAGDEIDEVRTSTLSTASDVRSSANQSTSSAGKMLLSVTVVSAEFTDPRSGAVAASEPGGSGLMSSTRSIRTAALGLAAMAATVAFSARTRTKYESGAGRSSENVVSVIVVWVAVAKLALTSASTRYCVASGMLEKLTASEN